MLKYLKQINAYPDISTVKVFKGLNGIKGLLILLVIITHCLPPGMLLYFLYMFHMPVFLAIGGFLLKESAFQKGLKNFFKNIGRRLVIPWLIACIVYLPFQLESRGLFQLSIYDVLYPYYHLWYIPAYILGSLLCYCIIKWKVPVWPLLFVCGILTFIWYVVYRDTTEPLRLLPLYWLGDKRIYAYLFFFLTGFSLRNRLIYFRFLPAPLFFIICSSFMLLVFFTYGQVDHFIVAVPYLFFNFSLILLILLLIGPLPWLQNKLFLLLNTQSMGVYLYHPIIILLTYKLLGNFYNEQISILGGLGISILTICIVLPVVWLLRQWSITDKFLLGNVKKKA